MKSNIVHKGQYYGDMEVVYPIANGEPGDPQVLVRMMFADDRTTMMLAIDAAKEVFCYNTYESVVYNDQNMVELTIRLERGLQNPRKYLRSNAQRMGKAIYDKYNYVQVQED